jgi:hypothetical protein
MPSVNKATDSTIATSSSTAELGNVLPWIIYATGTAPEAKGPIMFSKLDIKDGYWRMVMPEEEEWNFTYILPKADPQGTNNAGNPIIITNGMDRQPSFLLWSIQNSPRYWQGFDQ